MRLINRTAVTVIGARPYLDWTKSRDLAFKPPAVPDAAVSVPAISLSVPRAKSYGTAFLLPEFELEEDLQEWVEENYAWVFEFQLAAWTEDESAWPANRDLKMFREWFRIDIHSAVVDVPGDDIEGEDI
jgi:hypothetical protein